MSKKIIVRIAEGVGNQLFMYAHAYALSKKINYDLYIDNTSGEGYLMPIFGISLINCNFINTNLYKFIFFQT